MSTSNRCLGVNKTKKSVKILPIYIKRCLNWLKYAQKQENECCVFYLNEEDQPNKSVCSKCEYIFRRRRVVLPVNQWVKNVKNIRNRLNKKEQNLYRACCILLCKVRYSQNHLSGIPYSFFDDDWEKREIEKRMKK